MSLATPRRIFAKPPHRLWLRNIARVGVVLAMMIVGAGGGALLAAGMSGGKPLAQQAASLR